MEQLKIKGHNNQFKFNVSRHLNFNQGVNKRIPSPNYGYTSCGQQAGLKTNENIDIDSFSTSSSYVVKDQVKGTNDRLPSKEVVVENQSSIMHSPDSDQPDSPTTASVQQNKQVTVMPTVVAALNSTIDKAYAPRESSISPPPVSSPNSMRSTSSASPNMDRSPQLYSHLDEDKNEKENVLAMEYNAAMKRYTKKIEDERNKGKDIHIIKDTKDLTKDIFWFLKHRMIHSVFDKIIKMEYGEIKDESKHISIEDENSNGVNVELDGRSVNDEVTTNTTDVEEHPTALPESNRSDSKSLQDSKSGDSVDLKSDSKVVCTESSKPKKSVARNLDSAKKSDSMESPDSKSSTNPDMDAESTRRSISDFLLKKLLFPYDSTLFERSKKPSMASTKREKDKDRKGKLVEIHVNRDEQYGKTKTATDQSKQYKDSQRYSEYSRYQTSSTKVNQPHSGQGINICVRKRTHEGSDATSTLDKELTCNYCSDTNKKLKCHHETTRQFDAVKQQSTSVKPGDINTSISQCDVKPQDLTKGNQHQNDLSKPKLQENAQVCQNSKCKQQTGILTKSDIVNLIIQRIYFEENEEDSQIGTKSKGGSDVQNHGDVERSDSSLPSSDVNVDHTIRGNERTMQLPTHNCDNNINVDKSGDNSEFDNLLTKYKKYPIANKTKVNVNRNTGNSKLYEKTESVSSDNTTFCGENSESIRQTTSSPSGSGSGENQCSGSDVDVGDTYECSQSLNVDGDDDVIDLSNKSYSLSVSDNRGSPEAQRLVDQRLYSYSNEHTGRNGYRSDDGGVINPYDDCDTRYKSRFQSSLDTSSHPACDNSSYSSPLQVVNRLSSDQFRHSQYEQHQTGGRNVSTTRSSPSELVDYTFRDKYCAQTTQSS